MQNEQGLTQAGNWQSILLLYTILPTLSVSVCLPKPKYECIETKSSMLPTANCFNHHATCTMGVFSSKSSTAIRHLSISIVRILNIVLCIDVCSDMDICAYGGTRTLPYSRIYSTCTCTHTVYSPVYILTPTVYN